MSGIAPNVYLNGEYVARDHACCGAAHAIAHGKRDATPGYDPRDLFLVLVRPGLEGEVRNHVVVFVVLSNEPNVGLAVDAEEEALGCGDERGLGGRWEGSLPVAITPNTSLAQRMGMK